MLALRFGNQSFFLFFMIHDCTHKSSYVLFPTIFFLWFIFFMWYILNSEIFFFWFCRHLVCDRFSRTTLVLDLAFALNLPSTLEGNSGRQTQRKMNLLTYTGGHFFAVCLVSLFSSGNSVTCLFVTTPVDHNPRLCSVVLHGIDLNINSITFQVIRNFDFQYCVNFVFPRINPFGLDPLSSRRDVYSRHEPGHPSPAS